MSIDRDRFNIVYAKLNFPIATCAAIIEAWEATKTEQPVEYTENGITEYEEDAEEMVSVIYKEAPRGERACPQLLSDDEKKDLLDKAEKLWKALEENNLGGFSGINRPFLILHEFKEVIEQYGGRDVGLTWSVTDAKINNLVIANDNRLSDEVENLRDAIVALEENAYELQGADFDEVERLAKKLMEMVEDK